MRMTVVSFELLVNIFGLVIFLEVGFCLFHAFADRCYVIRSENLNRGASPS
jgi:hypothetical protein